MAGCTNKIKDAKPPPHVTITAELELGAWEELTASAMFWLFARLPSVQLVPRLAVSPKVPPSSGKALQKPQRPGQSGGSSADRCVEAGDKSRHRTQEQAAHLSRCSYFNRHSTLSQLSLSHDRGHHGGCGA